ncbi:PIN domain-containing protein [Acidomonas methanolica]|uniref:PIN domain-containing protein n=1 Tax=Acidomonas methanolica TaxID=437 RepID=UPI00211A2E2B|nr:PIN domain-containing protein [Acidomonas methanolica]MCQ9156834.1 PIN domain-containing protein [Acidomonas methanolica]
MPVPIATLDACVLFQGWLTDLLLNLAEAGAFEPIWSDEIHREWMTNLQAARGIPADRIAWRRREMERAFPAANVTASAADITAIQAASRTAAQRKDAHVVATAALAEADFIVTHNIKDFAPDVLARHGLVKIRPDAFCADLLRHGEAQVLVGIRAHRASLRLNPLSAGQYIDHLAGERLGLSKLARGLGPHRAII